MGIVDDLLRGREAYERREWAEALERLSGADPPASDPEDLGAMAVAAYLVGDGDASVRAWQRAFRVHLDAGNTLAAVRDAFWIGFVLTTSGNESVGSGWASRATRLLNGEPEGVVERGYLLIHDMYRHIALGEFAAALPLAAEVAETGRRCHDPDLVAEGLCSQGRLLIYSGRVPDGLALLDEAMVGVAAGEVSPIMAGSVYCSMIEGCQEIGDVGRMVDWTGGLTRWCESQPGLTRFTGQCAVHRAQIMRAQGAYGEALTEIDLALARYEALGLDPAAGLALYERGEVLRIRGEYDAATVAYDGATAYGHDPQPGLVLLWLAKGRPAPALRVVRRLLDERKDPVGRSRLLPAAIEVLLAAGEHQTARETADELTTIAADFACTGLDARAAYADGIVTLAGPDPSAALPALRTAWTIWSGLGARYDAAWARVQIAEVLRVMGDEDSSASELAVARRCFVDIGADPALREVDRMSGAAHPDGLTAREIEVLGLVAAGHGNQHIAAALHLSDKTVARHLSNIFAKIDVSSRTAAAAYAFDHGLTSAG